MDELALFEHEAVKMCAHGEYRDIALLSSAISLKRIADFLTSPGVVEERLRQLSQQPVNHYGEGLSEAIQNSIVRGKDGVTY